MHLGCLIEDTDSEMDMEIYRIFPKRRVFDILQSKQMALVRPELWDDKYENFILKVKVKADLGMASMDPVRKKWYGMCWSTIQETDAMWKVYSPYTEAVKVKTTVRKLRNAIAANIPKEYLKISLFMGKVAYSSLDDIKTLVSKLTLFNLTFGGQMDSFAALLCIKRQEYSYESEIRILFNDYGNVDRTETYYAFPFDANAVFSEIILDPRVPLPMASITRSELITKGWKGVIGNSDLYQFDLPPIPVQ